MLVGVNLKITVKFRQSAYRCQKFYSDLKILYFGNDNFSLPSLKRLSQEKLSRLEVVTSFKARNNPIKSFAETNEIKLYDWAVLSKIENYQICREFDLGLVVSFGHLIPEVIINSFKNGMLNVHGSLLPKYRGSSPIIYALRNGEKETGVTIMKIRPKKFDIGEILTNRRIAVPDDAMLPEIHSELAVVGADLLVECIKNLDRYKPLEQDSLQASYAPRIDNTFCVVRWNEMSSTEVFNLYRSIYSFKSPLTSFKSEPVKLIEISRHLMASDSSDSHPPGHLKFCWKTKKVLVKCADENFIVIHKLGIGKRKAMSANDFNRGFLGKCEESERHFD